MLPLPTILLSAYVLIATVGLFVARWVIKQYDRAPNYNYVTGSNARMKYVYSLQALNTPSDEFSHTAHDEHNDDHNDSCTSSDSLSSESSDKLQTRLPVYQGPNPFTIKQLSNYERFKIYFFCISGIALFRFIAFFVTVLGLYFISLPITLCASPNGFMHAQLVRFIRYWIGVGLFLFSFYFIDSTDSRPEWQRKPAVGNKEGKQMPIRVIAANHSTIFDGLILLWKTNGIIAAKKEIGRTPLIGRIMMALGTLWIDREHPKGRDYAKQQIMDLINDFSAPPLIIFPQGTCSNVHTVTSFKTGAYLAKQKVLEVSLNWSRNKSCDLSFVSDINPVAHVLHVGCCQFINYCHVDIHHEHMPNEDERNDVTLFALNSRKMVLRSLNTYNVDPLRPVVGTKHSYSDWYLLQKAFKSNPNFDITNILMEDIISTLQLRTKTVTYLAGIFAKLDLNKSGFIEYEEFCKAFDRDPKERSKQMRDLFNVFTDFHGQTVNRIGFNAFLTGVATCFMDDKITDAVKIMFHGNKSEGDEEYVVKEHILYTYQRHTDESKIDKGKSSDGSNNNGYGEWMKKMKIFLDQVFEKKEKLTFEEFYESVRKNRYEYMVHHYLQTIITMRLKIKLTKKDFVAQSEIISVNPLTELIRSTSIQSVHQ